MAFPQDRTPLRVELAFGADLTMPESTWPWTEVSGDLLNQQVTITRGRADEAGQASPTSAGFELDNPHGDYTPGHPRSQYYPHVQLGTPCRIFGDGGESYLKLDGTADSYAHTPDTAALDITGPLDLRWEGETSWYAPTAQMLIGKWGPAGQRSYHMRIQDGYLYQQVTYDGTAGYFVARLLPALPRHAALRTTMVPNDGAGNSLWNHYWAPTMDGPWTPLDTVFTLTAFSPYAGTSPLTIAPRQVDGTIQRLPVAGRCTRAEVRDGINGTLVADVDVRTLAPGTTAWVDAAGRPWTLGPDAEITDRRYRMAGTIDDLRPSWPYGDLSTDTSPGEARVSVTVSGTLRRLGQGQKALDSTLRRRIPAANGLLAYWPLEEGDAATTQAFSPLEGVQPMTLIGADWAADDTLAGSAPLPTVRNPTTLTAPVPAAATTGWQIEWVYQLPALPAVQTEVLRVRVAGATMRWVILYASTSAIRIETRDADFVQLAAFSLTVPEAIAAFAGKWNRLAIYTGSSGGVTLVQATWRDIITGLWYYVGTTPTSGQGRVDEVSATWGADMDGLGIGHLAVFSTPGNGVLASPPATQIFEGADDGFFGETAGQRFQRLCGEEGVPAILLGPPSESARMGPQRPATLLSLLQECAAADGGMLTDRRDAAGLEYRPRATLYNQPPALTLDAADNEIINPFAPVLDDMGLRNDVTVSRPGGSSARVEADASIATAGRYDEQITVNVATDEQLEPTAAWRVHLGTWPGMRYPAVVTELSIAPHLVEAWLQMDVGDRCQVTGLPPQHPTDTVDSLVQGYTETISPTRWSVSTTCSPAGPWTVGVVEDPVLGRADTDGTELSDAV